MSNSRASVSLNLIASFSVINICLDHPRLGLLSSYCLFGPDARYGKAVVGPEPMRSVPCPRCAHIEFQKMWDWVQAS